MVSHAFARGIGLELIIPSPGLPKAEYAVGYFTEMGIGCRRDPLEANVWYVRAADHGDERPALYNRDKLARCCMADPCAQAAYRGNTARGLP